MATKLSELTDIQTAIIKTIIFFDLFSHPLTAYELWRYLDIKTSFEKLRVELQFLLKKELVLMENGFYFLPNKEKLLLDRHDRYHYTNRKIKIALKAVKIFKLIPTVKFVALSNLIGRHNLRDASDIDIFIIAKKNRVWLTRLFCAGFMKLLGKRPSPGNKRDKICLSFYVDEDHLDLSSLTNGPKDFYFQFWLAGLYPLYDHSLYHHRLMVANSWLKNYLPNGDFILNNKAYRESAVSWRARVFDNSLSHRLLDLLEYWSQALQWKIMPKKLKEKANLDSRVIVRDGVLKLYLVDRREEFRKRYEAELEKYFNE